jgi:ribosomal protein S14
MANVKDCKSFNRGSIPLLALSMKKLYLKDRNRRLCYFTQEKKYIILKYILNNLVLNKEVREFAYNEILNQCDFNSKTKIRNRCVFSNRSRSVYRKFKMSRIFFKTYALQGFLVGIKKSS